MEPDTSIKGRAAEIIAGPDTTPSDVEEAEEQRVESTPKEVFMITATETTEGKDHNRGATKGALRGAPR